MLFAKTQIIAGMKMQFRKPSDKAKSAEINLALALCLDELSNLIQSDSFVTSYSPSVAASDREITLRGAGNDLKFLFGIKYGSGETQALLTYEGPAIFLRDFDNPAATAGTPTVFTILTGNDGFPVIKFNVPAQAATTLTVYYWPEITPDNVQRGRSMAAIVTGAIAYFYGIDKEGAGAYERFRQAIKNMRGADDFMPRKSTKLGLSKHQKDVFSLRRTMQNRRA